MSTRAQILRLSRLGATEQAWAAYNASPWRESQDFEARVLRARLLKDQASRAQPPDRASLYSLAGAEYAQAAQRCRSTYALINAASLSLLGDDRDASHHAALSVLALLKSGDHDPDTPYWLAATEAEANLLLGNLDTARDQLAFAISQAPNAWEDHAITLRQFSLLLMKERRSVDWLDEFRPPPILHFSGTLGIDPFDEAAQARINDTISKIAPCVGIGALAAGADILCAESILRSGAELRVVLPCEPEAFARQSVDPAGSDWRGRFADALAAASAIDVVSTAADLSSSAILWAEQVAAGMTVLHARSLLTRAVAVRFLGGGQDASPREIEQAWRNAGHELLTVHLARTGASHPIKGGEAQITVHVATRLPQGSHVASREETSDGDQMVARQFNTLPIAIASCLAANERLVASGLEVIIRSDAHGQHRTSALAQKAAQAASPGTVVANAQTAAAALVYRPDLDATLVGSIMIPHGEEELWQLRPSST
jgi:hypothetical protein